MGELPTIQSARQSLLMLRAMGMCWVRRGESIFDDGIPQPRPDHIDDILAAIPGEGYSETYIYGSSVWPLDKNSPNERATERGLLITRSTISEGAMALLQPYRVSFADGAKVARLAKGYYLPWLEQVMREVVRPSLPDGWPVVPEFLMDESMCKKTVHAPQPVNLPRVMAHGHGHPNPTLK